jgi:hypothetical protein
MFCAYASFFLSVNPISTKKIGDLGCGFSLRTRHGSSVSAPVCWTADKGLIPAPDSIHVPSGVNLLPMNEIHPDQEELHEEKNCNLL